MILGSLLLSSRKRNLANRILATSWPVVAIFSTVGLGLALIFVSIRWHNVESAWRENQVEIARSDLLAIKTLFQTANPGEMDARSKAAIDTLTKGGELAWATSSADLGVTENIGELQAVQSWSIEPNGYQRLKLTCRTDSIVNLGNEMSLVRRFAVSGMATLSWWDKFISCLIVFSAVALGLLRGKAVDERKRLIASLSEWSNQTSHTSPSPALLAADNRDSVASFDPGVSRILLRATEGMQKRLEAVQHSVEQSSKVMSAMPVGVFAFDQKLKLLFVNRAGRELLGLGATFQFGQDLIEVIRQPTVVNLIQEVSAEPQIQEAELELPLSKVTLRLRAHPLLEPEHASMATVSSGVLLTVTDETRLKQLENARRDFTANVSHELKTPLSAIKAYAETLLMGALEDEEASHRFVERIAEQAHRLDSLIRDLLHLTKLQSQPDKPQLSNLLLDDVLKTCVEEHLTIGQAKKISIDSTGVEYGCRIEADLESLRTVIGNLLGNAVRYNHPEGWVKVSTRREPNHVVLIIADNGIGIPPEDLDRIFERFYRVEKARSQDSGGTGLGLSIVKHLVQGMSADIQVSSVLGRGSSFELRLKSAVAAGPTSEGQDR